MSRTLPTVDFDGTPVSKIGFGAMGISEFYGTGDEEEMKQTVQTYINQGGSFIDTADVYGMGKNEEFLAPFVQANRDKVFICTKFAVVRSPDGAMKGIRGDPEYVKSSCEASLKRLGVDYVDLYYQHRVDPNTPIEQTVGALKELQEAGKIKHIGLSECSADTLRRASKVAKIAAVQWEYSVFTPDVEDNGVLEACKELGITLVAYSPLARGMIDCQWKSTEDIPQGDFRRYMPRWQGSAFQANLKLAEGLKEISAKKGVTASQLALAWVSSQGAIPIPGTKREKYLKENNASAFIEITEDEHLEIRKLMKAIKIEGDRYADMRGVNL